MRRCYRNKVRTQGRILGGFWGPRLLGSLKGRQKRKKKERKGKEKKRGKEREKGKSRGTKREKIDREVNQHDKRGAIQVRGWPPPFFTWICEGAKCTKSCELTSKLTFLLQFWGAHPTQTLPVPTGATFSVCP